jgi:hypothetical protein
MTQDLNVGVTGTPSEPATGVRRVANSAVDAMKRETRAVVSGAAEHPHTATGLLLALAHWHSRWAFSWAVAPKMIATSDIEVGGKPPDTQTGR